MLRGRYRRMAGGCAVALLACADKPASTGQATPAPLAQPAAPAAQPLRTDAACAAPFELPASRAQIRPAAGHLKLGILAGLKNADEENVAHLRKLVAEVIRRGAEVLVADSDLGDNPDEQDTLLGVLTETRLPVLALSGNREVRSELDAAENELRKRGGKLWDLSHTRIADLGDAVVVGLAGTMDRRLLHADGACVYGQKELDALAAALDRLQAGPPVILVMAVPPRGQNALGLDFSEGQNLGDPRLLALLSPRRAALGIFAQVWEAGGRAIDGRGTNVPPGVASEQLYLNPGAADRTPWPMADGTRVPGQAAVLSLEGRRASVEIVRLQQAVTEKTP